MSIKKSLPYTMVSSTAAGMLHYKSAYIGYVQKRLNDITVSPFYCNESKES